MPTFANKHVTIGDAHYAPGDEVENHDFAAQLVRYGHAVVSDNPPAPESPAAADDTPSDPPADTDGDHTEEQP